MRVELNVFAADTRKLAACLPATGAPPDGATAEIALPAFVPTTVAASQTCVIRAPLAVKTAV